MNAIQANHSEVVRLLLAKGADPNTKLEIGDETALMVAVQRSDIETVRALLSKGADPKARNQGGATALDIAISLGKTEILELLQKAAAEQKPKNSSQGPILPQASPTNGKRMASRKGTATAARSALTVPGQNHVTTRLAQRRRTRLPPNPVRAVVREALSDLRGGAPFAVEAGA